jgi:hypothetical protein
VERMDGWSGSCFRAVARMAIGKLIGFGYAGLENAADLRTLLGDDVDMVIDVRIRRWSGILAFSTSTPKTIEQAGYEYLWVPGLGNAGHGGQGPMRLANPDSVAVVVSALGAGRNVALMCACLDRRRCHRRLIIDLAREAVPGLRVRDLADTAR